MYDQGNGCGWLVAAWAVAIAGVVLAVVYGLGQLEDARASRVRAEAAVEAAEWRGRVDLEQARLDRDRESNQHREWMLAALLATLAESRSDPTVPTALAALAGAIAGVLVIRWVERADLP